jgi:hypothetical protein
LATLPSTPDTSSDLVRGSRHILLNTGANPYNQPVQVEVRPSVSASDPSSLLWTVGFGASARIDLACGLSTPLNLNLAGYDQLRLDFGGLSIGSTEKAATFTCGA